MTVPVQWVKADMRLTTIIGAAIAIVGLAACGSTVAPIVSPTLEPTVASTIAPTVAPTVAPTPTATPVLLSPPTGPPILTALCAPSPMKFAWTVSFGEKENNYNIDLSFNAGSTFTTEETSATQPYSFYTPNALDQGTILVRWHSYPSAGISAGTDADSVMCNPALLPPPTIFPLCRSGSGVYSWNVSSATQQVSWDIDIRYSLVGSWIFQSAGGNAGIDFDTPSAVGTRLYVRWANYPGDGTSTALADTTPCS
ncbi:MAG: hypothetical protein QOE18_93 [Chloroflexota bacterium]|nr:hypothetical protein [Chloroflexota bacterium]